MHVNCFTKPYCEEQFCCLLFFQIKNGCSNFKIVQMFILNDIVESVIDFLIGCLEDFLYISWKVFFFYFVSASFVIFGFFYPNDIFLKSSDKKKKVGTYLVFFKMVKGILI